MGQCKNLETEDTMTPAIVGDNRGGSRGHESHIASCPGRDETLTCIDKSESLRGQVLSFMEK